MPHRILPLSSLVVNRANDRHGELENETAAIAWLFNNREQHMRNLAKDIVETGEIYEAPLVSPNGKKFIVFDGNRRVTCLKLLRDPRKAPSTELQEYFQDLRSKWRGGLIDRIQCQVETDRERVDEILYRRHTGTQSGVGQSTWDDRMKANFVARTGKGGGTNVAEEIEKRLSTAGMLPSRKKIPRSTLNRLLSAEAFRNRLGFSINKGRFIFTHREDVVLGALQRVADDLANRKIVLGDIWDVDDKRVYLDKLESEGVLPTAAHAIAKPKPAAQTPSAQPAPSPPPAVRPARRITLIPDISFPIAWAGRLQRHRAIWDELQFRLHLADHPNAISVLFRVLLELSIENYISQSALATVHQNDKLSRRALCVAQDLHRKGKIDQKYVGVLQKFQQLDPLVSMDTLNRYVHSPNFAPSPEHLAAMWDTLAEFVVHCLNA
jgi:hypothetical protein